MAEYPKKFEKGMLLKAEELNKFVDIYNEFSGYDSAIHEAPQNPDVDQYYLQVRDTGVYPYPILPLEPGQTDYRPEKPEPFTVLVAGFAYYYGDSSFWQGISYGAEVPTAEYVLGLMVIRDDQPYPHAVTVNQKNSFATFGFEPSYAAVDDANDDSYVDSSKPRKQYGIQIRKSKLKYGRCGFVPLGLSDKEFKNQASGQSIQIVKVVREQDYPRFASFQNAGHYIPNDGEFHLLSLGYYNTYYGYNLQQGQMEAVQVTGFTPGGNIVTHALVAGRYQYNINIDNIYHDYYYYFNYYQYPFQDAYLVLQPIKCKIADTNWQPIGPPITHPLQSNYYYYGGFGFPYWGYYGYGSFNTSIAFNGVVDLKIDEFFGVLVKSNIPLRYNQIPNDPNPYLTNTTLNGINARVVACG